MSDSSQVSIYDDRRMVSLAVLDHIVHLAAVSTTLRKRFCIALSGGSLVDTLVMALDEYFPIDGVDWSTWHVFWADERWVPWHNPESNFRAAHQRFLSRVPIPETQIYAVDTTQPLDECAQQYASTLKKVLRPALDDYPQFDLILLGIGLDGHTASLFPGHAVLQETRMWVSSVANAPKPPPQRITLTLPVINRARHVAWVVNGSGKADIVARLFNPSSRAEALPAGRVSPLNGKTRWFLDQAAAAGIEPRQ